MPGRLPRKGDYLLLLFDAEAPAPERHAPESGENYSPFTFAMISFDTFAGTSAYESKTME